MQFPHIGSGSNMDVIRNVIGEEIAKEAERVFHSRMQQSASNGNTDAWNFMTPVDLHLSLIHI